MPRRVDPPRASQLKSASEVRDAMERTLAALKEKEAKGGDWRHWLGPNPDGSARVPHARQVEFLGLTCLEALYGGAAGGGKSDALLMAALMFVHHPGYHALIIRKTFADLALPNAIMDRAKMWLVPKGVRWESKDKKFTFPSGATLSFGFLEHSDDVYRYQGAEISFLGVDELTQLGQQSYTYLLSRLRRLHGSPVPIRARATANPGGVGHEWVKRRFVDPHEPATERIFVPAKLADNPSLDAAEYRLSLAQLDPVTRKQLEDGLWIQDSSGLVYSRFDPKLNVIKELPQKRSSVDHLVLGVDPGYTDDTAFSVLGWIDGDQTVYVIESFKTQDTTPSDAANVIKSLDDKYKFDRIVADVGGLGKGYAEEAKKRFHIPIEPAAKANKRGYQSLLNGALADRRLMLLEGTTDELVKEWLVLPWAKGRRRDEGELVHGQPPPGEADGFDNHCCFVAGTKVLTWFGEREIESVKPGDWVWGRRGPLTVLGCLATSPRPIWRLTLEDGRELLGTHDHPIWTQDGWKPLWTLTPDDTVSAWRTSTAPASRLNSAASCTDDTQSPPSANCEPTSHPPRVEDCTETSGHPFTGPYRVATTYITETRTPSTTIRAISRRCQEPTTSGSTQASPPASSKASEASTRQSPPLPHGTHPPRGSHGMLQMGELHGSDVGPLSISAQSAETNSSPEGSRPLCAAASALPGSEETRASTTRRVSAPGVEATSESIGTRSRPLVPVRVGLVERTPDVKVTYNLSVDGDHEYLANDILVANCDATLYAWRACVAYTEESVRERPALATKQFYDEMESNLIELAEDKYGRGDHTDWWLT